MKKLFALACAIGACLVLSTPVAAMAPVREPAPVDPFDLPGVCAFTVHFDFPVNQQTSTTYFDKNGVKIRQLFSGKLVATLTNLSNGKSLTADVSAPETFEFYPDGLLRTLSSAGHQIDIIDSRGLFVLGSGGIVQRYADDPPDNTFLGEKRVGHWIDVCPLLS